MRAVTLARGTALTNHSFRLQCWRVWRELRLARRPACAWRDIEQQYPDDDIASRDLRWWQSRKSSPTYSSSTEASSFRTPSGLPAAGGVDGLSRDSRNEKGLYEAGGIDGLSRAPRDVQALREAGGVEGLS